MAQKDPCNASKGINSEFKTINATCSCMKCDSMYCFSKRHDVGSCSCENCKESKTCLFYNNKMVSKESHSHTMTSARGDNIHSQHFTKDIPSRNTNSSDAMTNTYDPWKYTSGLCKNELGIPKSTLEPRKNTCASCTTDAMTNTYSETPKNTHNEAPKNTYYEASRNILEICKNVLGTPRSTSESWKTTKPLQDNKQVMPNYKSEPNCDCEDPWNTIEQPDNKYSRKANCECDPWNTIDRPGNKYFAKKQYFCDCIEQPKNRPKPKQIVSNPPGYIMDIPKPEPADMKNKFKPDTRLKQMDTINIQKNKCLPNADDCNCKEPTTTLKLSINVPYETPNNQIETQRNTYITQKNNCNCKTSTKRESPRHTSDHTKHKHDPSNNRQRYCTNKLETKTFEVLNKTFQQKLFDCNDLLRNFNTSELPGYVLDLPKRSHKKDKLELCKNILENQRDAINTLNQMYLPQKKSCTCNEIQTKISKTEYNFESQQHSNHKHNIIEKLENKYLQEKEMCICDGSLKNTSESKGCMEGLQNYNELFNKKQKSCCNCDDSPKSKPKSPEYVFDLQKSKHMPSNKKKEDGCKCDGSAKNTSEAPGYIFEVRKSKHKPYNKTVEDCCNYGASAKNTNEYPGYVFEVQKSKHEPTKGQDFTIKKFGGSAKTTSESPGCIELARYKHELSNKIRNKSCNCHGSGKHISEPPGFIIDIQNYKHEPSNKIRKDSCNCDGTTKNTSESSRYVFELQKSKHKPSNKTREDGCNCDGSAKNTSEPPGHIFEVQKSKHKPPNKTMGDCCNYGGSVKNTSESPGYVFEVQRSKHEPTKGQDFIINRFDGSAKKTSESSGCIELARYKNELSNKIRSTSCNCHGSGKHISNPPGFIFEIQKYKHESSNKTRKESCNCDGSANNTSESPGYIFEVQKSKHKPPNKTMGDCCNYGGSVKNTSESAGYVFEVQKSKHEPTKGQDFTKNRFDGSAKKTSESSGCIELARYKNELTNKIRSTSCNCHGSGKHISNPPGFIFEIQKYKHEPSNKIRKESCNCDGIAKNISESSRCVFELQKSKQKPSNQIMGDCYGLTKNISESPGYVFEVQKSKHTPSNKIREGGCNCDGSAKNTSESPGYIFEVQKSKHKSPNKTMGDCCNYGGSVKNTSESPGYVFEVQKSKHEPTKGQDFTINRFDGSAKKTSESSGCIELARYKNELSNKIRSTSCNCHGSGKHISNPPGFIFEIQKYKHESSNKTRKESCNCDGTAKNISESSRYAFELQNSKQKSSNQIMGDCYGPTKNTSESPGYVFEVQKSKHTPSNKTREGGCNCDGSAKNTSESSGYIFEVQKSKHKSPNKTMGDCCNYGGSVKNTSESPGYVFEVQKSKHEPTKGQDFTINRFDGSAKKTSESSGCIELARYKNELSNKIRSTSCNCHGSGKHISNPPGFIFEIQKYKHESSNKTRKESCNCDGTAKNISESSRYAFELQNSKQKSSNQIMGDCYGPTKNTSESPGYVFEVQKSKHTPSNKTREGGCNCDGSAKKTSESPGYVFEVQKSKHEPIKGQDFTINRFDGSAKTTSESPGCIELARYKHELSSKIQNRSCNCHGSGKHISEPPGFVLDIQKNKHKPSHQTQEDSCNCDKSAKHATEGSGYIFEVQQNTQASTKTQEYIVNRIEINNTYPEISSNYNGSKIESPGYVFDLQKYKHKSSNKTQEDSCKCDGSAKNTSESPGYVFEVRKSKYEPTKVQEFTINRFDSSAKTTSESPACMQLAKYKHESTNKLRNPSCNCHGSGKHISDPPGYILEVQTSKHAPFNKTMEKRCNCDESAKDISESPGYIFEVQKYTHDSPKIKEYIINRLEIKRNTFKSFYKAHQKNDSNRDSSTNHTSKLPIYISGFHKYTAKPIKGQEFIINRVETSQNILDDPFDETHEEHSCVCDDLPNNPPNPLGYVFELQNYSQETSNKIQELLINRLEVTTNTIESLNETYQKNNIECDDLVRNISEPPGYILDLQENTIETLNNIYDKKNCVCNKPLRKISESPGYIYGLQKYKIEPSNNTQELKNILETQRITIETLNNNYTKNSFEWDNMLINVSEPPGYIFDLQKHTQEPSNDTEELNNALETLNNTYKKKTCVCNKPLRKISKSPGYIYGLQKYKQQLSNTTQQLNNILETQRITIETLNNTYKKNSFERDETSQNDFLINVSEPPGYIFDLQKHTQESSNDTEELTNALETFHNTHMKKICDCNKPLRKISESPGYIYGLEKYKIEPSNNTQELKNILETQRITIETLNNTYKKNSFERDDLLINVSEPPGYIFDLQKHTQEPSNDIEELTNVLETLNNTHMKKRCDCNKPLRKISESPGYIYGIQKYKQEPSNNTQELKNILETQRITIETLNNNYTKNSFEWDNMLINVSKPAGYIFDLQKHTQEPSNDTEEFTNVFETITNTHMKKKCDCNKPLEKIPESPGYIYGLQKYKKGKTSKSDGYIFDLPKHTNEIQRNTTETLNDTNQKNSCNCIESSRKSSISSEYILDLPKQNELTYNTQALCKNILEAQTYIIETLNNTYQKNRCNCKELSRTSKSSEYIFDLPKHTNEISHNTQKLFKNIHETHRNTIETLNTYQKTSCNCNESSRKTSESSGFMFELPKHANELSNNTKHIFKNAHETQRDTIETLNNIYQKTSCNCDNELSRKTSESSGYMFELPKHANELSNNIQKIFKNAHETPRNTIETLNNANQKNSCNCHEPSRKTSDSSGYIFKLPKHTNELSNNTQELCKNILGGQRNTIETLNNAYQIKSCSCNGSPRKSSEMSGYILELQKYEYEPSTNTQELSRDTLETQKFSNKSKSCKCNDSSRKSSISSGYVFDLSKHTKNIIEKRKDTMENLVNTSYSPLENICNSNNQMKINSLKKIYLPPKYPMNNMNDQAAPAQNVMDSRKELSPGTAMLSAEVMNLPYTDFSNSFANKQTDSSEKGTKLSRYDIFRRIKEAYKACSCKVCECIAGKPLKNDVCQCKPCECTDCTSYLNKIDSKQSNTDVDVGKFPCDQCYRDHSKKVTEGITEWSTCDCKPCDCIQCVNNNAKHCDCEPCQCIECKPMMMVHKPQTLVVAPVGENIQRLACTCSPCDCLECGQGHNAASSLMHEMGTGTNRHALCRCENCLNENCDQSGVDSCKCERRNRVMSKPVEKDTHDYDIRTATVFENNPFIRSDRTGNISHDTTALFAAINNKYPSHDSNNDILSNTKSCSCEECECIACVCKEDAFNAIKSSQLFSSKKSISDLNISNTSKLNTPNNCKCKICECQICDKYITQERMKRCLCVICDCINCEKELRPQYSIHKCERCFLDESHPNSTVHTVKKSEVLTTSCHQTKVQSLMLGKQRFELPISSRGSPNEDSSFKIRDISHYALSKHDYHEDSKQPEYTKIANRSDLNDYERRYINTIKQCDAYKQSQEKNKGKHLLKNNSIDNDISGSYYSGYSSLESSSRTSCHKDYGSITPISRNKNKSWESSCNSSGYDYPDYLIQFPKSTVETCLKDVMELDIDETIKLDKFNIIPKHHVNKTHDGSEKEKLYQANESNFIDSANSNLLATKRTEYTNEFKSRTDCSEANLHEYTWDGTPWDPTLSETCDSHKYNFELSKSLHLNKQFDTSNSIENENYSAQRYSKQIPYSSFVCGVDILNIDDDNKRVQKTLQEAKEYSLELMRLLEMYEKANQEFESVSEKLKISHESLLSDDFFERKEIFCIQRSILGKCIDKEESSNKVEYKLPEIHLKVPSIKENLTTTSVLRSSTKIPERTFVECENGSNLILQKRGIINLNNNIINLETPERLNTLLENNLLQQIETRLDKKDTFNGNETKEEIINNHEDIIQKRLKTAYKLETAEEKRSFNENQYNQGISKKDRMNNKNLKKYSKLLKRTIIISKRISIKNSTESESKPVFKYFVTVGTSTSSFQTEMNAKRNYEKSTLLPTITSNKDTEEEYSMKKYKKCELNQIMKKLDMVFGRIEEVSVSTSTDTYGLEKDANSTYELENSTGNNEVEEAKPWPILKKNFTWNTTPYGKNKGVCIFPPLELQIKQAVQSISLQTTDPKKKIIVPHHENQALVKLQTEVTKLLDMPILQPQIPIRYPAGCSKETLNIPPKSKLELKLKETPEVSLQTKRKDVKSVANEVHCNNYTKNLQIRNYSSQSVFRLNKKKKNKSDDTVGATSRISSIGSSNSNCCCEALKVGFLGVRRVSDHTVLIKWNVPRLLTKVQGYELLVDGRAVQKIFSPSKNMAVVTCLPHTDKVLLTIRTITSSVMLTGHYPATTIIYRPRVK